MIPGDTHQAILMIGGVEIIAGVLVAVRPQIGGYVVALWLAGIIVNLISIGEYYDIALRDFGLLVGALALARLAVSSAASRPEATSRTTTSQDTSGGSLGASRASASPARPGPAAVTPDQRPGTVRPGGG